MTHGQRAGLPPRWFMVLFWHGHRALLRVTRGRLGLWRPRPGRWGAMWLTTTGRRSGRPRQVVVGYLEDGRNLVTMAMNGWGAAEPAWWLNLLDQPEAIARTRDGSRPVRARRAQGEERERLWSRWAEVDDDLDAYAALRPTETAVVVFEPSTAGGRSTTFASSQPQGATMRDPAADGDSRDEAGAGRRPVVPRRELHRTRADRVGDAVFRAMTRVGIGPAHLLTTRGRRSGRLRTNPVILVERDSRTWLVSPYGEVSWVLNARAAGRVTLRKGRSVHDYAIREVSATEAGPVLKAYVAVASATRPYFYADKDSPAEEFVAEAAFHPVFELL